MTLVCILSGVDGKGVVDVSEFFPKVDVEAVEEFVYECNDSCFIGFELGGCECGDTCRLAGDGCD